jgi:ATP-dependent DNA helicase RecG
LAEKSGFQGAFLAPTEILASQHFYNAKNLFKSSPLALLTGSTSTAQRNQVQKDLEEGKINIIFGTHALLNEKLQFKNLGMVVIDEQHRFGVSQRAALFFKGNSVDLLVTTATPIPRTLLLSLYNDLAVSVIKTKPKGRLPIITKTVDSSRREEFYVWLREKVKNHNKAYIVLPLIEDSEYFPELRSVKSEAPFFKEIFKDFSIAFISGKIPGSEKEIRLKNLIEGKVRVLISTTVIEVGIDVKDVTYMVIENADHYGLSQLHQLRGRVGRGDTQSFCYLFSSPNVTEKGKQRLQTIVNTEDGFEVAETDLKMRGGGLISGFEQSGYLDFKLGDTQKDLDTFRTARQDAALILKDKSFQNSYIKDFLAGLNKKLKNISFS